MTWFGSGNNPGSIYNRHVVIIIMMIMIMIIMYCKSKSKRETNKCDEQKL